MNSKVELQRFVNLGKPHPTSRTARLLSLKKSYIWKDLKKSKMNSKNSLLQTTMRPLLLFTFYSHMVCLYFCD